MKQYSVYFDEPNYRDQQTRVEVSDGSEVKSVAMTQPGVLIINEEDLADSIGDLIALGMHKIVFSGNFSQTFEVKKRPVAAPEIKA